MMNQDNLLDAVDPERNDIYKPKPIISTMNAEVNLFDPDPATLHLEDIAWALSGLNRYTAHAERDISVAAHSIAAASFARAEGAGDELQLAILMHDAAEAYMGDIARPLKQRLRNIIGPVEMRLEDTLADKFGHRAPHDPLVAKAVKYYDNLALSAEVHEFFPQVLDRWENLPNVTSGMRNVVYQLTRWHRATLAEMFITSYDRLTGRTLSA